MAQTADYGVDPAPFRLRVWRAAARALQEVCDELRVDCLMPPPDTTDADGYLREDMIGDGFHGNLLWGQHIVAHLVNRAGLKQEA